MRILLGCNCLPAAILKEIGLRNNEDVHLPFDYLVSSADAVAFYLNTEFRTYLDDFEQREDGTFYNVRADILPYHENEPDSHVKTLDQLSEKYRLKAELFLKAIAQNGDNSGDETIYFIRFEPWHSTSNYLRILRSLQRLMKSRQRRWKLLYIAMDPEVQRKQTVRIGNGEKLVLPVQRGFDWKRSWKEMPQWPELVREIGGFLRSRTEAPKVVHTPEQKVIIPGCRCAFFPVEFAEPYRENLTQVNMTLAAIVRNCGSRVREWLAFHRVVGFRRFLIALNRCDDNTEQEIRSLPFFEREIILHKISNGETYGQQGVYQNLLDHYGATTNWIAYLDDDEFLFGEQEDDLNTILKRYDQHGGLFVHWCWFGSNGHTAAPQGLVIENYTRRAKDDYVYSRGFKSIFKPSAFRAFVSSHRAYTEPECVFEDSATLPAQEYWRSDRPPVHNILRVNHYKTRSMEDWVKRFYRGNCNEQNPAPYDSHRFRHEDRNEIEDLTILRFADRVRKEMQSWR